MASYDIVGGVLRFTTLTSGGVVAVRATRAVFTGEYLSAATVNGR